MMFRNIFHVLAIICLMFVANNSFAQNIELYHCIPYKNNIDTRISTLVYDYIEYNIQYDINEHIFLGLKNDTVSIAMLSEVAIVIALDNGFIKRPDHYFELRDNRPVFVLDGNIHEANHRSSSVTQCFEEFNVEDKLLKLNSLPHPKPSLEVIVRRFILNGESYIYIDSGYFGMR